MKILSILMLLVSSASAFSDQRATLSCKNDYIILEVRSPYTGDGENEKFTQSLYVLKLVENESESRDTAYFLDDVSDEGSTGITTIIGNNKAGGYFKLEFKRLIDVGDGTIIQEEGPGELTYSHGPLKGDKERVDCVRR